MEMGCISVIRVPKVLDMLPVRGRAEEELIASLCFRLMWQWAACIRPHLADTVRHINRQLIMIRVLLKLA